MSSKVSRIAEICIMYKTFQKPSLVKTNNICSYLVTKPYSDFFGVTKDDESFILFYKLTFKVCPLLDNKQFVKKNQDADK